MFDYCFYFGQEGVFVVGVFGQQDDVWCFVIIVVGQVRGGGQLVGVVVYCFVDEDMGGGFGYCCYVQCCFVY